MMTHSHSFDGLADIVQLPPETPKSQKSCQILMSRPVPKLSRKPDEEKPASPGSPKVKSSLLAETKREGSTRGGDWRNSNGLPANPQKKIVLNENKTDKELP